jgi:hypothetical protein
MTAKTANGFVTDLSADIRCIRVDSVFRQLKTTTSVDGLTRPVTVCPGAS